MGNFHYFMPTDCYFGRGCVAEHKAAMAKLGKKAMVVTGKTSAKRNGAQQDITDALDSLDIAWILFDEIEENPSVETVERRQGLPSRRAWNFSSALAAVPRWIPLRRLQPWRRIPNRGRMPSGMQKIRHCRSSRTHNRRHRLGGNAVCHRDPACKKNKIEHCRAYLCHSGISRPEIYGYPACKNHKQYRCRRADASGGKLSFRKGNRGQQRNRQAGTAAFQGMYACLA